MWRTLDEGSGPTTDGSLTLTGAIRPDERPGGVAEILVQSVPRPGAKDGSADGAFADPADYDFAISHLTDTQYLTEAYPEVYAEMVGLDRREPRPPQDRVRDAHRRSRAELGRSGSDRAARASRVRDRIEHRGGCWMTPTCPTACCRATTTTSGASPSDLFNEYFGPDRYEGTAWYGGSIAPGDNSGELLHVRPRGRPKFLMLSLPYAYGEREIAWAEDVVAQHPDPNVDRLHARARHSRRPRQPGGPLELVAMGVAWRPALAARRRAESQRRRRAVRALPRPRQDRHRGRRRHRRGTPSWRSLADYQEFRTHSGERSTGFQRLLQFDLAGGRVAVDTLSSTLGAMTVYPYDYEQFVPDNGQRITASNARPWQILADGLQDRYTGPTTTIHGRRSRSSTRRPS